MEYGHLGHDRKELRGFLRARREHLRPEDVGILPRSGRRARGVTREEVAELADVSIGWYAQFELGRPINVSLKTLYSIARALRLDHDEARFLYQLAGAGVPPQDDKILDDIPREVLYVVESFIGPAFIFSRRFDVLFQNEAARLLLNHEAEETNSPYNAVLRLLTDPSRRHLYANWEYLASRMTSGLHHNYARALGDPWFEDLIARLHAESPEFTYLWNEYRVAPTSRTRVRLNLDSFGSGEFTWVFLPVPEASGLQLVFTTPADETSSRNLNAYLEAIKDRRADPTSSARARRAASNIWAGSAIEKSNGDCHYSRCLD
jgi:transcriptional regulator with XRE-family HTH domain